MKRAIMMSVVGVALASGVAFSGERHPNLSKAHNELMNADKHITEAQRANEFDMGGHAAKAKQLIGEAMEEVRLAREAANGK